MISYAIPQCVHCKKTRDGRLCFWLSLGYCKEIKKSKAHGILQCGYYGNPKDGKLCLPPSLGYYKEIKICCLEHM
jgi:hypothetical protein